MKNINLMNFIYLVIIIFVLSGCNSEKVTSGLDNEDVYVGEVVSGTTELNDSVHVGEHDHSVEIEGSIMKTLTVKEVADLWGIDGEILLAEIINEFNFKGNYDVDTVLEEMRQEYKFSPAIIKDLAESIKTDNI